MKVYQVELNSAHFNAEERGLLHLEHLTRAHAQGGMLIVAANYSAAVRLAVSAGHVRLRREHMSEFAGPLLKLLSEAGLLSTPDSMIMYTVAHTGPIIQFTTTHGLRVVGEWLSARQVRATDTNAVASQPVSRAEQRRTMQAMHRRFLDLDKAAGHMRELGENDIAERLERHASNAFEESRRLDKELYG